LPITELIKTIASVSNSWRVAAFAIAAILLAIKFGRRITGNTLVILAGFMCILGLAPIVADHFPKPEQDVYRVRVLVTNPQNIPVTGATLRTAALNDTAVTAQGIAELTIPRATLSADRKITIYADLDNTHDVRTIQLADDFNPTVDMRLVAPHDALVSGLVEDDAMHAIAGATVSVLGGETGSTAKDGTFKLKANAAVGQSVRLHAEKPGYTAVDQWHPAGLDPATIVLSRIRSGRKH
jgi:hypothetical protein